ncbi:hypothetical protein LguiA_004329 [Lonicera macranthoides]
MAIKSCNCFHENKSQGKELCEVSSNPHMIMFGAAEIIFSQIPDFDKISWLSIVAAVGSPSSAYAIPVRHIDKRIFLFINLMPDFRRFRPMGYIFRKPSAWSIKRVLSLHAFIRVLTGNRSLFKSPQFLTSKELENVKKSVVTGWTSVNRASNCKHTTCNFLKQDMILNTSHLQSQKLSYFHSDSLVGLDPSTSTLTNPASMNHINPILRMGPFYNKLNFYPPSFKDSKANRLKNGVIPWRVIRYEPVRVIRIGGLYEQKVKTFAGGLCNSSFVSFYGLRLIESVNLCAYSGLLRINPALQGYLVNSDVCLSV